MSKYEIEIPDKVLMDLSHAIIQAGWIYRGLINSEKPFYKHTLPTGKTLEIPTEKATMTDLIIMGLKEATGTLREAETAHRKYIADHPELFDNYGTPKREATK